MVLMMKALKTTLLSLVLTGLFSYLVSAQQSKLAYADRQFELKNFRMASDEYSKLYSVNQEYETAKKTALSLDRIYAYSESYGWWKIAVGYPDAKKEDYASLVRAGYRSVENYNPSDDLRGSSYALGDFEEFSKPKNIRDMSFRKYEFKGLDEFNSTESDYSLSVSKSGQQFFASNRGEKVREIKPGLRLDAKGNQLGQGYYKPDGQSYYGIYTKDSKGGLTKVQVEGYQVYHLTDPRLLSNGIMFFTATPNKLSKKDEHVYPGIFYGMYDPISHTVKDVKSFPYNKTDKFAVISPNIDEDADRIYFSSNRPGGFGGYDLYYVTVDSVMNFSEPVNLGLQINSEANERDAVRVGEDLYFSSDRAGGFGGLDVYTAKVQSTGFSSVSNLGQPINSVADDFGFTVLSGNEAYFSSDRTGGRGFDDLYRVTWSDRNVKVFVVDVKGNSLKEGTKVNLIDAGKSVDISKSDEKALVEMTKKGNTYTFAASRQGYFSREVTVSLNKDQEEVTVMMVPIPYGLELYEAVIYYDLDKDNLKVDSKVKLDQISAWMVKYPELNLVIESHTDSRATDLYNQRLSERRAKSVTKYLDEKGVDSSRIKAVWMSENKLANDCGDGVPCDETLHQQNRRSELKLIGFPDSNKTYELPSGADFSDFKSVDGIKRFYFKQ